MWKKSLANVGLDCPSMRVEHTSTKLGPCWIFLNIKVNPKAWLRFFAFFLFRLRRKFRGFNQVEGEALTLSDKPGIGSQHWLWFFVFLSHQRSPNWMHFDTRGALKKCERIMKPFGGTNGVQLINGPYLKSEMKLISSLFVFIFISLDVVHELWIMRKRKKQFF